jgi:hypothetical protein
MTTSEHQSSDGLALDNAPADAAADVIHLRFSSEPEIDTEQAAEYLGDMLSEMRLVAAKAGMKFLSALIEVAIEEAKLQAQKQKDVYLRTMKA